ncbi:MAG: GCN5-related N-acetyltransferase [Microgenomates group bacterium GW2011_GWA2_46_7]|nr:MAG: GCN5-related N-acetyltransferase [Microgenomates group bacterium GW2011_GWC2_46_7]KKU46817.1 MAG: GCN5-related N-acetyltransferase [Microgenomates group bacterium GW2011_GWA2_46_7]
MNFEIILVKTGELNSDQQSALTQLNRECFGDVPPAEITDNFFAEPFVYLFAIANKEIISRVALFKRTIQFDGQDIIVGGIGGVCVATSHRHHGIASSMVKRALVVLRGELCDVACLNVDLAKPAYHLYEKLGFTMMSRDISFENVKGELVREGGTMFIPLASPDKYQLLMTSSKTFHYGRGYW